MERPEGPHLIGRTLAHYRITAALGAGGMGEVYRATDSKLDRDVAIKVLPAALASDPDRLTRFEREAKLLAHLNHSNIAHVYGFERATLDDGKIVHFLAMELVEGEDLAERLKGGAIPLDEAIVIGEQIAEALEEAHEKGIVHRDLKPANVKATPDGKVKVLDFGLAKAWAGDAGTPSADLSQSPTLARAGTEDGLILGTAGYMSPEQARGKPVDKRADIWAFGVVLFEMLTGKRLFEGETASDVLAGVLKTEIDLAALPEATPLAVRRLLRRCLERDPRQRLRDIGDARLTLSERNGDQENGSATHTLAVSRRPLATRALPWVAGLALGALIAGTLDRTLLAPSLSEPPRLVSLTYSGSDSLPTASSDGRTIAFTSTRDGRSRIWLKQLATGEEVALTAGPADLAPSFSPDGNSILFLRGATPPFGLFLVSAVGGDSRRLSDGVATSAVWAPDGQRIALTRASTPGGVADTLVSLGREGSDERVLAQVTDVALASLRWSPDGRTIGALATLSTNNNARLSIVDFDVASGRRRTLYQPARGVVVGAWTWSGAHALLTTEATGQSGRGDSRLRRIEIMSEAPTSLISLQRPSAGMDLAGPGRVVIDLLSPTQNLFLMPLAGGVASAAPPRLLTRGESVDRQPIFFSDGARVAFSSDRGGNLDIWELNVATGALRRLTVAEGDDWDPAFSHDGKQLLWSSNRTGHFEVWIAASDGSGARKVTADGVDAENPTMTPDGRWIVYASANPAQNGIWKIHPDGTDAGIVSKGPMQNPELSPDGRWISFIDTANNRLRVVAFADGADVATIDLPSFQTPTTTGSIGIGRSRWLPGSSTLAWVDYDLESGATRLVAQEIAPGSDTHASRRTLMAGTQDQMPESFGISPNGQQLLTSVLRGRSNLLLVDGLPGVKR